MPPVRRLRKFNLTTQRPAWPYFSVQIQLYAVLLELSRSSTPTQTRVTALLKQIRDNARVAGFKNGPRLKTYILKHLVVADQNQILTFKVDQDVFSLNYYGIYMLQKHLRTDVNSDIPSRGQVLSITSAVKARLPQLNLRQSLAPFQIQTLRTDISKCLDREEYTQLTNLQSFVNAEHSNAEVIHSNNQRLREISRDCRCAAAEIRCCESEIFLAVASRQPYDDVQARLVALEEAQIRLEREHDSLTLHLHRLHTSNASYRGQAQHARVTADLIRQAAKQVGDHKQL